MAKIEWERELPDLLLLPWVIFTLFSAAILAYQALAYLQSGAWPSISVLDALVVAGSAWASSPDSWFGLHAILGKLPLSLAVFLTGLIFLIFPFGAYLAYVVKSGKDST